MLTPAPRLEQRAACGRRDDGASLGVITGVGDRRRVLVLDIDRSAIMRFRLSRHHLDRRLPAGSLVGAAAVSGIRETSRRTAGLAVHVRVADAESVDLDHALT
jgi:hypothetical protein